MNITLPPFPWIDESVESEVTEKTPEKKPSVRRPGSASLQVTESAARGLRLITDKFNLARTKIGPEIGSGNVFASNLINGRFARVGEDKLNALAALFNLTVDELCALNEENFDSFKTQIQASKKLPNLIYKRGSKKKKNASWGWRG